MTNSNPSTRVEAGDDSGVTTRHDSGIVFLTPKDAGKDYKIAELMARALPGWRLERVEPGTEALSLASKSFDACLPDPQLDLGDHLEVLCRTRSVDPGLVVVLAGVHEVLRRVHETEVTGVRAAALQAVVEPRTIVRRRLAIAPPASTNVEAGTCAMNEFVAILSHELRAPLHTMTLAIEALGVGELAPTERAHARVLLARGLGRLSRTVEDLLDVTRAERGELATRREPVDLAEVARVATDSMRAIHATRGLSLDASETRILGDAGRLEQVVENLVANAFRHAADAHVTVRVRLEGNDAVLRVEDDGPGFPSELLDRVFERFAKGHLSHERGGGLGRPRDRARDRGCARRTHRRDQRRPRRRCGRHDPFQASVAERGPGLRAKSPSHANAASSAA